MIQRSVDNSQDEPAALVRLLPAQVEIALAAGDEEVAAAAARRLDEVVSTLATSAAATAANACVAGLLLLHREDLSGAAREFEKAVRSWQQARNPYEAGQARMRLATVLAALGDLGYANLELAAARTTFERLGAGPEAREAARRLGDNEPTVEARAFMFTDIVNSTALLTTVGDAAWHGIRQWHDRTVATIVGEHRGRIVKETGDGFFAAFDDVTDGVNCAIAIQRALDDHRRTDGFAPSVRIGLHVGTAVTIDADFAGRDVVVAARIGSLAGAEQILVSGAVADQIAPTINVVERTARSLKGIPETVDVATVDWR
jgi:class 3 adenylate cyclase